MYVSGIKQYYSVGKTEPLYGTGFLQYVSLDLTEPFNDSGINHYSSAVISEPLYCSGINRKKILCFNDLRKVCKNYRAVSIFVMWNLLITQDTRKKYRTIFFQKKIQNFFRKCSVYSPVIFNSVGHFFC